MGTDTICRGTFWVQTQNLGTKRKTLKPLKCLARQTYLCKRWQISLMLLIHDLGSNQNFGVLKEKCLRKTKNKVGFK